MSGASSDAGGCAPAAGGAVGDAAQAPAARPASTSLTRPASTPQWSAPAPLEGVKSRKRAIFALDAVGVAVGGEVSRITGVSLTLESRIAAVGAQGHVVAELLLGERELVTGRQTRHNGLNVAHLGPHLAESPSASAGEYASAIAAALQSRPQVVVVEDGFSSQDDAWAQVFAQMLDSEEVRAFRGAVVFCVAEATPAVQALCPVRWSGEASWLWQDSFAVDELEISEDVLGEAGTKDVALEPLLKEVSELSDQCFSEDCVAKSLDRGWSMSLLTAPEPDGGRSLAGFICYKITPAPTAELHIARLAVPQGARKAGCGQRLMRYVLTKAARLPKSDCAWISLSALDTAVPFYEKFGFVDMTSDDLSDPDHFQTWMELPNISVIPAA